MGKHFDTLVEFTKRHIKKAEKSLGHYDVKQRLEEVINQATLFEIPFDSRDILPISEKNNKEYQEYLCDYFDMSKKYGSFFLTPFPVTAIEDNDGVVIFRKTGYDSYFVVSAHSEMLHTDRPNNYDTLFCGNTRIQTPDRNKIAIAQFVQPHFGALAEKGIRNPRVSIERKEFFSAISHDLQRHAHSYIEENVYIMDPENFIIRKESNQSRRIKERKGHKKNKKLEKTVMRPHYIILSEQDTGDLFRGQAKEPRPAHPVKAHWRTLLSQRYINKKGQKIFVPQYFTGNGKINGTGGWTYEVMIKKSPDKIVTYEQKMQN